MIRIYIQIEAVHISKFQIFSEREEGGLPISEFFLTRGEGGSDFFWQGGAKCQKTCRTGNIWWPLACCFWKLKIALFLNGLFVRPISCKASIGVWQNMISDKARGGVGRFLIFSDKGGRGSKPISDFWLRRGEGVWTPPPHFWLT